MPPSTTHETGAERRAPRQRAFLRAKLAYLDGSVTYDCAVVQLSATGARLAVTEAANIPDHFHIEIPQKRFSATARLVRRDPEGAAIAFENAGRDAAPHALLARLRELEAENKALRETCKTLMQQLDSQSACY
jgi:hypothetical protein